ncbi:MAG: FAD binding domain-containing protein [Bosea sp. (in: a-proteobacteria)]
MKWPAFGYVRAATLDEFWKIKAEAGPDAKIIAGGQSLLATLAFRLSQPSVLIDISRLSELKGIAVNGDMLRIGALTRHVELERSEVIAAHAQLLQMAVPLIAHPAIRNRGTIGGSLAFADPAAELPACLVALGATIMLASEHAERQVPAASFFLGLYETEMRDEEIIVAIEVPKQRPSQHTSILEIARRSGDYAMAGLACSVDVADGVVSAAQLVYFGVGEAPVQARAASAALVGKTLKDTSIAAAQAALADDLDPPDDLHGPAAMKLHLSRVLTGRALGSFMETRQAAA